MGCHSLLQGIFPTEGSNLCLLCFLHCQADSLPLNHLESPSIITCKYKFHVSLFYKTLHVNQLIYLCQPDILDFPQRRDLFSSTHQKTWEPSSEKSRDITLPTKVCTVRAMVFPVVMYGCERWIIKKVEMEELMLLNCGVGKDS